jgi:copper chaperone NosL
MKQWKWLSATLLLAILVIAGCSKEQYPAVAINEEVDRCEICNMAIKDDAYATQLITKEGRSLKFDDLGCLNQWRVENGTEQIAATYVRDYNSLEWVKYDKAYYVYDASIGTPMAYGILSFHSEAEAQDYITEHGVGTLLTADGLTTHSWAVNKEMMGSHEHGEDHSHGHEAADDEHSDAAHHETEHGEEAQH